MFKRFPSHLQADGEVYRRRLKKEAVARRILNLLSVVTPRVDRVVVSEPRRIAVLCQWGIGDAVLLLPLLRALRRGFPDASLELVGKGWLSELLEDENCCDRVHLLVPPWTAYSAKYRQPLAVLNGYREQVKLLRQEKFDWLISARFDPREILQLRLLSAKATFGCRAAGGRYWITNDLAISRAEHDSIHRAELASTVATRLLGTPCASDAFFLPDTRKLAASRSWLTEQGYCSGTILAVHTGAGHPNRRWKEPHFNSVLQALHVRPGFVVFIEDPGTATVPWSGPIPHAHWMGTLSELKSLLAVCDAFLGTDSGVMHMASAAGCKIVGIFGSAEPKWFGPAGGGSVVIHEPMPCRPCFDQCIYARPVCTEKLSDRTIIAALDRELAALQPAMPAAR